MCEGSTGYGKTFVSLDNGPFKREDSVKDMGAFLDVLGKDKGLDAGRFGLTGGSYGGYMCYAAAVQYKDKLRATNCIVAISNFVTFLENTQSYRRDLRRVEYGDERDPAQRAKLLEISPLTRVAEISKPMFVVTGGNDPRVYLRRKPTRSSRRSATRAVSPGTCSAKMKATALRKRKMSITSSGQHCCSGNRIC